MDRQTDGQAGRQAGRQANGRTDGQTGRQTGRQAGRQVQSRYLVVNEHKHRAALRNFRDLNVFEAHKCWGLSHVHAPLRLALIGRQADRDIQRT